MVETLLFAILSLFLVGGSLGMLLNRHTVFSAFSFMVAMIALAGMFALLNNGFLFLAQILVSVGAVVTLSLLVIVSVNIKHDELPDDRSRFARMVAGVLLVAPIAALLAKAFLETPMRFSELPEGFGSIESTGMELFHEWVLPFEILSILLLVSMVAAIVISKKRDSHDAQ